jgi:hypothetical protein
MKKVAGIGLISLFLATFSFVPAQAATLTASGDATGLCTQSIDNTTSVTAVRSGTDCIVTFAPTTSINYTWSRPAGITSYRVLLVAGGGGGGSNYGAGGGGGGFIDATTSVTNTTVAIHVGLGGTGSYNGSNAGDATSGENSTFAGNTTFTAVGGGRGGSVDITVAGASGGSGGGGGGTSGSGGSGTTGQGNSGGAAKYYNSTDTVSTGGGGGAGSAGNDGAYSSTAAGGAGGDGLTSDITGAATYYGGGGGGGTHTGSTGTCGTTANGGAGGGGRAGTCKSSGSSTGNAGQSGTNGFGGGGGGASVFNGRNTSQAYGGNGGAGVVVIRYVADFAPVITGPGSSTGSTSSISITENTTPVFTFSANEAVAWTLSGTDSATFTINSSGVLVTTAKDFEAPTDANTDNVYVVIVRATDSAALVTTQTVSITVTNLNETATISAPTITGSAYKGVQITISVLMNVPGKVRFFANSKRVGNCLAVPTTGAYPSVTATCNWKPTNRGYVSLTASVTPTSGTFTGSTSVASRYFILNKSTTR